MGRYIASVIVGYLAIVVVVIAGFSVSLAAPDFAYEKDSLDVTTNWLVYTMVLSFLAAIAGGLVAVLIGRHRKSANALAILAFALGMAGAITNAMKPKPAKQDAAGLTVQERGSKAVQPVGYSFALPVIGAAGIMLGGRIPRAKTTV